MTKKLLFAGFLVFVSFSAVVVFAAMPTISALSAAYKTYLTPPVVKTVAPKPIKISDLITAYKNYISTVPSQSLAPATLPPPEPPSSLE